MTQQVDERRKSQSKSTDICCWAVSLDLFYTGQVNNLSNHGLFINTTKNVPINSVVTIEFLPPNADKVICVKSKVIWNRKDSTGKNIGIGVEFFDLTDKDKEVISFYLAIIKKKGDNRK